MKPAVALVSSLLVLASPLGCSPLGCDGGFTSLDGTAEGGERIDPIPWREEWRSVIDQPFQVMQQ